ncbi:hypothetical protein EON67_08545, partial [archaeon]
MSARARESALVPRSPGAVGYSRLHACTQHEPRGDPAVTMSLEERMALDPVPATLPSSVVLQDDVLTAVAQQEEDGGLDVAVLSADLDHWDLFAVADVLSKRQCADAAGDLRAHAPRADASAPAAMPDVNAIARALIAPSRAASSSAPRRLLPAPPLSVIDPAEFVWSYPMEPPPFLWDVTGERNWREVQQVVDGLQRALRASLT